MIVVQICFFIADLLVLLALHQNTIVKKNYMTLFHHIQLKRTDLNHTFKLPKPKPIMFEI